MSDSENRSPRLFGDGLFLETTAQIDRVLGGDAKRSSIDELCSNFDKVGTSNFVNQEIEIVVFNFMREAISRLLRLDGQDHPRGFDEIWNELQDLASYKFRGRSLYHRVAIGWACREPNKTTPRQVAQMIRGEIGNLKVFFGHLRGEALHVFDRTSCCLWPQSAISSCGGVAHGGCLLRAICVEERSMFHVSVAALSEKRVAERRALRASRAAMESAENMDLLKLVAASPNAVGDILIFWEVPDNWSILTRDKAFEILAAKLGRKIEVLYVRLPRKGPTDYQLQTSKGDPIDGTEMMNHTARDLRLRSKRRVGRKGTRVQIRLGDSMDWHWSRVVREEGNSTAGYEYALRITEEISDSGAASPR